MMKGHFIHLHVECTSPSLGCRIGAAQKQNTQLLVISKLANWTLIIAGCGKGLGRMQPTPPCPSPNPRIVLITILRRLAFTPGPFSPLAAAFPPNRSVQERAPVAGNCPCSVWCCCKSPNPSSLSAWLQCRSFSFISVGLLTTAGSQCSTASPFRVPSSSSSRVTPTSSEPRPLTTTLSSAIMA
jgi:hypothetical protein